MKEIAAYILLVLGGNATPSAEDVTVNRLYSFDMFFSKLFISECYYF